MVNWNKQKAKIPKISTQASEIVAIINAAKASGLESLEAELELGTLRLQFTKAEQHTAGVSIVGTPSNSPITYQHTPTTPAGLSDVSYPSSLEDDLSLEQLILTDPEAYEAHALASGEKIGKAQPRRAE